MRTEDFQPTFPQRLVIHSTVDTRQRDPLTGKPLTGTGEVLSCTHCGKPIQVHTYAAICDPVMNEVGIVKGFKPVSETVIIGQDCAKKLKALDRFADRCNFKWIS